MSSQSLVEIVKTVDNAAPDVGLQDTIPSVGGPLILMEISLNEVIVEEAAVDCSRLDDKVDDPFETISYIGQAVSA